MYVCVPIWIVQGHADALFSDHKYAAKKKVSLQWQTISFHCQNGWIKRNAKEQSQKTRLGIANDFLFYNNYEWIVQNERAKKKWNEKIIIMYY